MRRGRISGADLHAARIASLVVALGLSGAGIAAAESGKWVLFGVGLPTLAILLWPCCLRLPDRVRGVAAVVLVALPCVALGQAVALVRWRYFV